MSYFLGIDVGTEGVRCIVADEAGKIAGRTSEGFERAVVTGLPEGWHEQKPDQWWDATRKCLSVLSQQLHRNGISADRIVSLCVDSTSGTILPVDAEGMHIANAIMYNDSRSSEEAKEVNEAGANHCEKHGYRFSSSFALAKILWIKKHQPSLFDRAYRIIHATDFIIGRLSGCYGISDISSSLKTGSDLFRCRWPDFIDRKLNIPLPKLPDLVMPGTVVGNVSAKCAGETGLSPKTQVVAGMTDGTAAFLSCGAAAAGEFNTTLGTTLVIKGLSRELLKDSKGRVYCHRHPSGHWLPGGASNVGGECLVARFGAGNLARLDGEAVSRTPTDLIVYPLEREGERLPFMNERARGFSEGTPKDKAELYAAHLEGVGYVEKLSYELLESLGAEMTAPIYSTGGGARSEEWMQIRADMLGRPTCRPKIAESAFGCCVLAASAAQSVPLAEATGRMVKRDITIEPRHDTCRIYEERYAAFLEQCRRRGYSI